MADAFLNVGDVIERQRMGRFQLTLAALLFLCLFVDGFEAQAPGFAAPFLLKAWQLPRAAMGLVFGAGNLGLMLGAALAGLLADRAGRRTTIIAGCGVLAVFSLLTMHADSLDRLRLLRLGSGIGVGGVLPAVIALGTEYAPRRRQAQAIWFLLIGYQAGASSGALVSTFLIPSFGWPVMFLVGGLLPLAIGLAAFFLLPESIRFLALQPGGSERVRAIVRRLDAGARPTDETRIVTSEGVKPGIRLGHLFQDGRAPFTLVLWAVYIANLMALQFLLTWLPTVLDGAGISSGMAALATVLVPLGGLAGGLAIGRLLDKGSVLSLAFAFALGVPFVALIGAAHSSVFLMAATFMAGVAVIGGQTNLHAIAGRCYPTFIRSNAVGWANAAGRIGSILGPVVGGVLIGLGLTNAALFLVAAIPPALAALGCLALARLQSDDAAAGLALESAH